MAGKYSTPIDEKYERECAKMMAKLFGTKAMFRLDGFLLKRYIEALVTVLGYKDAASIPEDGEYYIDHAGYSHEIAMFLGNVNYLYLKPSTYYAIIVSPEQRGLRFSFQPFSALGEAMRQAYAKYEELIKFLTKDNVAVLQIKFNARNLEDVAQVMRLRSAAVKIDTIEGRVSDIARIKKMADELSRDDNILNDHYIEDMMTLASRVGNIRHILPRISAESFTLQIGSFFIEYPCQAVMLCDRANEKSLFFHNLAGDDLKITDDAVFPVLISRESVISNLEKLGFVDYHLDPGFIAAKISAIEDAILLERGVDVNKMSAFELERERSAVEGELPPVVAELNELKHRLEKPRGRTKEVIRGVSDAARYTLAFSKAEYPTVNKLLSLFDRTNYTRRYHCETHELSGEIEKMPLYRKYYVLRVITEDLKRSEI